MANTYKHKAQEYCEKYGIVPYKITKTKLIYYANYPAYLHEKRHTYKCAVDLKTMQETRIQLKRYFKLGNINMYK